MARVLTDLTNLELYRASDATEALQLLEDLAPDVIVLDTELIEEQQLFLESLVGKHPPIVVATAQSNKWASKGSVTYVPPTESLDDLHRMLMFAAGLATKSISTPPETLM